MRVGIDAMLCQRALDLVPTKVREEAREGRQSCS
jgi:hypothetical protein